MFRKKLSIVLGVVAIVAVTSIALWRNNTTSSARNAFDRLSIKSCATFVGATPLTEEEIDSHLNGSLKDIAALFESKACKVVLKEFPASPAGLSLPTWVETNDGFCLIAALLPSLDEVCLVQESVRWVKWTELVETLTDAKALMVTAPEGKDFPMRLTALDDTIYLGDSDDSGHIERTVTLFNVGNSPIEIASQTFSCGCATATLLKSEVEPHGYCLAKVTMQLDSDLSATRKVKWLLNCSPTSASFVIPVSGRVSPKVNLDPEYYRYGKVKPSSSRISVQSTIACSTPCDDPLFVEPVFLSEGVHLSDVQHLDGDVIVRFEIQPLMAPRTDAGMFTTEAILAVKGCEGERRLISIQGSGQIVPEISVDPTIVNAGFVNPGEVIRAQVNFSTSQAGSPQVNAAHPDIVTARIDDALVNIEIKAPSEIGLFKTGILLRVGNGHVHIPVQGVVALPENKKGAPIEVASSSD